VSLGRREAALRHLSDLSREASADFVRLFGACAREVTTRAIPARFLAREERRSS
jgi:hypothetical protein